METLQQQIAHRLERQFDEHGFATQGVEALREAADVSLRTLYRYYPSREAMVIGALNYRDQTYREWIGETDATGADHILHIFVRLHDWLQGISNNGCLYRYALAAYPESQAIRDAVTEHKRHVHDMFRARLLNVDPECEAETLTEALFVLHEGLTESAFVFDPEPAFKATLQCARTLLASANIT